MVIIDDYNINIQMFYDLCVNKHLSLYCGEIKNLIRFFEGEERYEICKALKNMKNNLN
tara:strand:- start:1585 stop:1758 length:174 start_codon:yes stop_codon:yes gene_type:complete